MLLEEIADGDRLDGVVPGEDVEVIGVRRTGADAVTLTFVRRSGVLGRQVLYRSDETRLSLSRSESPPFDADGAEFRLAAEAQRIRLAGLHDPMLAVTSSDVQPLPHQIRAVYGDMLERLPLRYLLADDPGAGKTIMAGLLIKELSLREAVGRCLVVAPGGLVDQWKDELWFKFGLDFEILTPAAVEGALAQPVFDSRPRLIARMDQLARNDDLLGLLAESQWDLVVVDEAHRMSAHWFGAKLERSKRFQLGQLLGRVTRHLLLMTATPHSGKDDDFQLFLSLLDADRFGGKPRPGTSRIDASQVMGRNVKEDLLTFEGRPLFPDRIAETVPYQLTADEAELYEEVTDYVREQMGRADRLDGKRRNTVGFALTVLQRRLASSPEAIHQSLIRRVARLERRRTDLVNGVGVAGPASWAEDQVGELVEDLDDYDAEEIEQAEAELVDAATAARTIEELDAELAVLTDLVATARRVRSLGTDRKWTELRTILDTDVLGPDDRGRPRKLIVFTEHRDTLEYLRRRVGDHLGRPQDVLAIHGGVRRSDRRQITEEFIHNPDCRVLIATDAAGEGLNLQVAHLMVNYDLPWNPNRIEQRFGRIHRIGQRETCRLWNLVAENTREGEVFLTLLAKIEEQRAAYDGRLFDVLGAASFRETPLRELLVEAIRHGEQPEVRARMERIVDAGVAEGCAELLRERALAEETTSPPDLASLRHQMEQARARRLQPHFIQQAFVEAFRKLGGRMARRESGRFEITQVPPAVRAAAAGPVATRYERVAFEIDRLEPEGLPRAELLAPGHPLHDAVLDQVLDRYGDTLDRGTVLVSPLVTRPVLLVGVVEEVQDATGEAVSKRFGYAYVDETGDVRDAGPAPYLDGVAAPTGWSSSDLGWPSTAESAAMDWLASERVPPWLEEVRARRITELDRVREQVLQRMNAEINRLASDAAVAAERERTGHRVRETAGSLDLKRADLEVRLERRLALIERERQLSSVPPRLVARALVVPPDAAGLAESGADLVVPMRAVATAEVDRRAVAAVMAAERALGREPTEMAHNNPGYDVESRLADDPTLFIEVKGRIAGAEDFFVSHTEVRHGQNAQPHYRLALVRVDPRGADFDEVRYLANPFDDLRLDGFDAAGVTGRWDRTWARGRPPF